jgi:hypothetical protein
MSTGQTMLAIGALIILMNISTSIHRGQIRSLSDSLDHQLDMEAIYFGQSVMEAVFYSVNVYDDLDSLYGNFSDVTNPGARLEYAAFLGDTLLATIDLSGEKQLMTNVIGRQVTVRVFEKTEKNEYIRKVEYTGTVNPIW